MNVLIKSIKMLFELLEILIIVRVFMNIFRISFENFVGRIVYGLTEPIIAPAQTLLYKLGLNRGMIDFSPWIAVILLRIIYSLILRILI